MEHNDTPLIAAVMILLLVIIFSASARMFG